ncbi:MAG TPA: UDP-glucose 4-epimerase GalE [Verrucomicrobiae bacterium]|nr:UDP-glucose 4-epimerase GalE [Verrucomicrobiae bacterium]
MKILVTGGAGFIGSVVSAALLGAGHEVVIFDNFSKGNRKAVPKGAQLIAGDIGDRPALGKAMRGAAFDGVMNFAAFIEAGESMAAPEKYFRNNTCNTLTLLEAMLEFKVPRLVFSSTAALYGDPLRVPIEEDDPLRPTNAYGESKLLVERMLEWFHRIHGFRYASLRYFNAAGAAGELGEDHDPESHLIPIVLQAALGQRRSISIFGTDYPTADGTCVRDYIHVADLAAAHLLAFDRLGRDSAPERLIYNLGNGRGFSVRQVIDAARRVTGRPIQAVEAPRRPGDPPVLVASSEKIKRELGWQPQCTELERMIESSWEWRLRHPRGYKG